MNKPATKFAGGVNPFTSKNEVTITDDPITKKTVTSKYDDVLSKIKPGKAIRCPSAHVKIVTDALRTRLKKSGKDPHGAVTAVRQYTYPDGRIDSGFGRVWWVKKGGAA